ncbi:MAG TPA: hypothetical protein VF290_21245 [Pyrinomonadaceae bacterium]
MDRDFVVKSRLTHQPRILWLLTCKLEIVRGLFTTLKKIFFWNYARNTWQWDLLCVVILIFIFLTPKSWFSNSERALKTEHQSPVVKTVVIGPELVGNEEDRGQIEQRVKALTGRTNFEVLQVRRIPDADGRTRGFEVDIR